MASAPRIGAVSSTNTTPAAGWMASGGALSGGVDGIFHNATLGVSPAWRQDPDGRSGSGYFYSDQGFAQRDPDRPLFTPLMGRSASSFPASESYSDIHGAPPLFISDLLHAVGVYEFNMKAIAGTLRNQGSVINRFG